MLAFLQAMTISSSVTCSIGLLAPSKTLNRTEPAYSVYTTSIHATIAEAATYWFLRYQGNLASIARYVQFSDVHPVKRNLSDEGVVEPLEHLDGGRFPASRWTDESDASNVISVSRGVKAEETH